MPGDFQWRRGKKCVFQKFDDTKIKSEWHVSGPIVTPLPPRGVAIRRAPNTLRSTNTVLEQSLFPKHCGVDGGTRNTVLVQSTSCWLYHNIARRTCKSTRFSNTKKKVVCLLKMKVQLCSVALWSFPGWRPWQMPCVPTSLLPRYCWTLDNIFLGIFIFHKISYYIFHFQSCPYYWGISQHFHTKLLTEKILLIMNNTDSYVWCRHTWYLSFFYTVTFFGE